MSRIKLDYNYKICNLSDELFLRKQDFENRRDHRAIGLNLNLFPWDHGAPSRPVPIGCLFAPYSN